MTLRVHETVEALNARVPATLMEWYGARVTRVVQGALDIEFTIRPQFMAANGFLHAASVIALADTACGFGSIAHLPAGAENFTTIELKANFTGTAREGVVRSTATAVHLGRTTQVWDAVVVHVDSGRELAHFRNTQLVLWPRKQ